MDKFSKKLYRKQTLKNIFIFLIIFNFLLLIDLLTKLIFFKYPNSVEVYGPTQHNLIIFGIRSQAHKTTTFGDLLNINISNLSLIIISLIMSIIFFFVVILSNKKKLSIVFSSLIAGIMGNTIDRINYQYVRNILFIPWFDNGTFNLADAIITISALCSLVFLLIMIWNSEKKEVNK